MAEPFKNFFNEKLVSDLADSLKSVYPKFDKKKLMKTVFDADWEPRELKDRMRHITNMLHDTFDMKYADSLKILRKIADDFEGFSSIIFADYVEVYGLNNFKESVAALEQFTKNSSSEFAVRPFIMKYPEEMMNQMEKWSKSKNHHVRRLSSEGCRPRLPWAMALPEFKKDPTPILPILEQLKNDESEYVRKSVANNLNDISKDHPELVLKIAKKWKGKTKETDWIVKHACRTLLKKGNKEALEMFGVSKTISTEVTQLKIENEKVKIGDSTHFSFDVKLKEEATQKVRLEYKIHYVNASGGISQKIFKISEIELQPGEVKSYRKKLSFKDLTIRKHFPGKHLLVIVVNGVEKKGINFKLIEYY
jgi:3-methyladenine DNA glycosylase AlkC